MSGKKALVMMSGGLDSSIVLVLLKSLGVDAEGVFFSMPFCQAGGKSGGMSYVKALTEKFKAKLHVINNEDTLVEIIKNPKHGFGSNMNPCIDCRAAYFRKAKVLMAETGASFIATGEVLGQRPMSQRLEAMKLIEAEAGLVGLVLRPLSAKHLEESIPEKEGWVDRSKLYGIKGRGRREQMALAKSLGITEYPSPAGGCLLTDPGFSRRLKELVSAKKNFTAKDAELLKYGRHFRLIDGVRLVVGRNEAENKLLATLRKDNEVLLWAKDVPGPNSLLTGDLAGEDIIFAAAMTARFSDVKDREQKVKVFYKGKEGKDKEIEVLSAKEEEYSSMRI